MKRNYILLFLIGIAAFALSACSSVGVAHAKPIDEAADVPDRDTDLRYLTRMSSWTMEFEKLQSKADTWAAELAQDNTLIDQRDWYHPYHQNAVRMVEILGYMANETPPTRYAIYQKEFEKAHAAIEEYRHFIYESFAYKSGMYGMESANGFYQTGLAHLERGKYCLYQLTDQYSLVK